MLLNVLSFPSCYIIIKLRGITKFVSLDSESQSKKDRNGRNMLKANVGKWK